MTMTKGYDYDDDDDDICRDNDGECSMCGGDMGVLGKLGHTVYLLCRNCGMQHSKEE
jgi:hypothetical protein